jgi:hypothetical protein
MAYTVTVYVAIAGTPLSDGTASRYDHIMEVYDENRAR